MGDFRSGGFDMDDLKPAKRDGSIGNAAHVYSRAERLTGGKALREAARRSDHNTWKLQHGRPDPIATLQKADEGRIDELIPIKYGRMLQSPFAFYRGSAAI